MLPAPDATLRTCPCGFTAPTTADRETHILGCTHRRGYNPSTRHNFLRDTVANIAVDRGYTVMREPDLADGRADLAISHPTLEDPIVIDFTITNTTAKSAPTGAQAEARKKRRYGNKDLLVGQVDVHGGISRPMAELLKTLSLDQDDLAVMTKVVSKVVQKGNSRILLDERQKASCCQLTALNVNKAVEVKPWSPNKRRKNGDPATPRRPTNHADPATPRGPTNHADPAHHNVNATHGTTQLQHITCPAPVLPNSPVPPHSTQQQHGATRSAHDPGPAAMTAQIPTTPRCTEASSNDLQRDGARSVVEFKPTA